MICRSCGDDFEGPVRLTRHLSGCVRYPLAPFVEWCEQHNRKPADVWAEATGMTTRSYYRTLQGRGEVRVWVADELAWCGAGVDPETLWPGWGDEWVDIDEYHDTPVTVETHRRRPKPVVVTVAEQLALEMAA